MRAICPMVRRAPPAFVAMIGAPLWFGAPLPAAAQRADQTASGAPRTSAGAALPRPLAAPDAARLVRIFQLQAAGDLAAARREQEALRDHRLDGHILADRWLRPGAETPRADDARAWLARHGDLPDAPAIHALLVSLSPQGATLPPAPAEAASPEDGDAVPEEREGVSRGFARNPALDRTVRERAASGDTRGALDLIRRTRGMTPAYAAALRADIALALFRRGEDVAAFRMASEVARGRLDRTGRAAFAAGLAAWGLGRYEVALPYFETAARAEAGSAAARASAAFWTARAAIRARRPQNYVPWMLQAAQEPRTFHGLLARRALGLAPGFAWQGDSGGDGAVTALAETAGGWRALALLQIGQQDRAEAELRALWPAARGNAALLAAMLTTAQRAGLTSLGAQLAGLAQGADGRPRDLARFPLPRLEPAQGFRVDPSLLYAMARQESNFDPAAVSRAGARGLLQVMPSTAAYVANDPSFRGEGAQRLHDPALSLEIGQRYMLYLANHEAVQGDLIRLLAAYNAGPGNLARWLPAARHRVDPFLFIEAIPVEETRVYVQRVLAYSWIYASRLNLPTPSLEALARGAFPRFVGAEELLAQAGRRGATLH
ncbi:lytic transglycosylase domain-containing protein [Roseomonas oryzicola]|uniref:Lytic transglycosylase domain-containing protein n=1 Tax=Neoroseomonas oryzicola TaxID=535904 RepID=A0A9X9WPX1_9PROT|nr:lytic transglycosylase domain-containing protein [Neoroseomonas oryzicola]NKE16130.1 lytic transglycosylase domain-containing protein [Neoroseomonas oryzicola]